MDRRELLKVMALTLGGSLALPESAFAKLAEPFDAAAVKFFEAGQRELVAVLAETIIPRTDTPGAIDAGVPGWIELLVQDCLEPAEQAVIVEGLATLEKVSAEKSGKAFAELSTAERIGLLTEMEKGRVQGQAFIRQFKELTKFTYASSEKGATEAFELVFVPGRWDPALELKPGQKAFAM
jgi:hypothetical protein